MSFAFRRRHLTCFYCGSRSAQQNNGPVQQFRCRRCEAVNFLDEYGNVTDPPIASTGNLSTSLRFASPQARSVSPPLTSSNNVFCDTCLKNQHILTENLASYLPPEDSPQYQDYLAAYDSYRRKLEERYPQICAQCLPRARERIKRATYVAKTDYLRRMVERTRSTGVPDDPARFWRSLVLYLGSLSWWCSAALQLCWHALASQRLDDSISESLVLPLDHDNDAAHSSLYSCARNAIDQKRVDPRCASVIAAWMPAILFMAGSSLWWNNRLREKYLRTGGRMTGLLDYYILQSVTFGARLGAWRYLSNPQAIGLISTQIRAAHIFMAIFVFMSTLFSSRIVKLDTKPRFSFHLDDSMILPDVPEHQSNRTSNDQEQAAKARELLSRKSQQLLTPMSSSLSSSSSSQWQFQPSATLPPTLEPNPPTPPPEEEEDPDRMDWTPSKPTPSFNSASIPLSQQALFLQQQQQQHQQTPSPFHGALPAPPRPQAYNLRQPEYMKPKRATRSSNELDSPRKENLFSRNPLSPPFASSRRIASKSAMSDASEDSEEKETESKTQTPMPSKGARQEIVMAPARLTLKEDVVDTGLESLFDVAFSIADTPKGVKVNGSKPIKRQASSQNQQQSLRQGRQQNPMFDVPSVSSNRLAGFKGSILALAIPMVILFIAVMLVKSIK